MAVLFSSSDNDEWSEEGQSQNVIYWINYLTCGDDDCAMFRWILRVVPSTSAPQDRSFCCALPFSDKPQCIMAYFDHRCSRLLFFWYIVGNKSTTFESLVIKAVFNILLIFIIIRISAVAIFVKQLNKRLVLLFFVFAQGLSIVQSADVSVSAPPFPKGTTKPDLFSMGKISPKKKQKKTRTIWQTFGFPIIASQPWIKLCSDRKIRLKQNIYRPGLVPVWSSLSATFRPGLVLISPWFSPCYFLFLFKVALRNI